MIWRFGVKSIFTIHNFTSLLLYRGCDHPSSNLAQSISLLQISCDLLIPTVHPSVVQIIESFDRILALGIFNHSGIASILCIFPNLIMRYTSVLLPEVEYFLSSHVVWKVAKLDAISNTIVAVSFSFSF